MIHRSRVPRCYRALEYSFTLDAPDAPVLDAYLAALFAALACDPVVDAERPVAWQVGRAEPGQDFDARTCGLLRTARRRDACRQAGRAAAAVIVLVTELGRDGRWLGEAAAG